MIAKLITGNGFGGAVRYSTKYGKEPDGTLHKLLSVSGVTVDYDNTGLSLDSFLERGGEEDSAEGNA